MNEKFLTKSKFTDMVKARVLLQKMSYIDAILQICEENGIDPEDVRKFISPAIKDKVTGEASRLNLIESEETLNFD